MKIKLCVLIFILTATLARAQTNDLTSLLQQGLLEEQANRNLDAAVADYQSLALQFDKNRQIAATAIFRLGECYRMQSQTNEAAVQYQRILSDFSDQSTLATMSRQNLTGMGMTATPKGILPDTTSSSENQDVALWNKLKGLPGSDVKKILPTLVPDSALTILLQRYDETEALLAQMQVSYGPSHPKVLEQKVLLDVLNKQINDRVSGILDGLKMRAEIAQAGITTGISAANNSTDAEDQEIQRIQTMIQNSPDLINATTLDGNTPLAKAAANGWLKVATYLLDHGADVNNHSGTMPLVAAATVGNKAMTQFLLDHGADVNAKNNDGKTPLTISAERSFPAVMEVLLANKADINALENWGRTPLMWAAWQKRNGSEKIMAMLLEHKPEVNTQDQSGATALMNAAVVGSLENVKALLAAGAAPNLINSDGRTALSYAAEKNSPELVKMLLAAKADPNIGTLDLPLLVAIHQKDAMSAELLLQAGANPNALGKVNWDVFIRGATDPAAYLPIVSPLYLAVSIKQFPLVQLLLKYKADPNDTQTDGRSLLFSALSETNILEALLDAGAKVDARDSIKTTGSLIMGWTPLLFAVENNNSPDSVKILLKHGANPNLRDSAFGQTPLHWISGWADDHLPNREVLEALLDSKADPNVRNNSGETPLARLKRYNETGNLSPENKIFITQMADLLRQHGALDVLPDWDHITVSRPSANFSKTLFYKGTNDWNQVSLYDLIGLQYDLLTSAPAGRTRIIARPYSNHGHGDDMSFPDFTSVVIHHPSADGLKWETRKIDLSSALNSGNCDGNVLLQFGDVVEIPEANHVLNQLWDGLTTNELATLKMCLTRHLQITVNGQTTNFIAVPQIYLHSGEEGDPYRFVSPYMVCVKTFEPFMLWPVLDESKTLLSSSDLSQVKVKRADAATGKIREWTVDCSDPKSPPNFWLRDGDLIDVPEK